MKFPKTEVALTALAALILLAYPSRATGFDEKHNPAFGVFLGDSLQIGVASRVSYGTPKKILDEKKTWAAVLYQYIKAGGKIPSFLKESGLKAQGEGLFFLPYAIDNLSIKPLHFTRTDYAAIRTKDDRTYRSSPCAVSDNHFYLPYTVRPGEHMKIGRELVFEIPFGERLWWPDIAAISFYIGDNEYPLTLSDVNEKRNTEITTSPDERR